MSANTLEDVLSHEEFREWLETCPDDHVFDDLPMTEWMRHLFRRDVTVKRFCITIHDFDENGDIDFMSPDWMDSYINLFCDGEIQTVKSLKESVENMNELENLFVYGTLQSGECNNFLLKIGEFVKKTRLNGFMLSGSGVPFAVKNDQDDAYITGELWKIPKFQITGPIDLLEGHPVMYTRTWVDQLEGTWLYLCQNTYGEKLYHTWETKKKYG